MSYSAVLKSPDQGAAGGQGHRADDHRGPQPTARSTPCCAPSSVAGSYLAATRSSPLLDPSQYGLKQHAQDARGLPVPRHLPARQAGQDVGAGRRPADATFKQQFAKVNLATPRSRHLTPYDVLIVASLIEGEAATQHDRPLVASVIYNRLARRDAAAARLDDALCDRQLHPAADRRRSCTRARRTTPAPTRACRRRRSTAPGWSAMQAAAHPAHDQLPVLLHQALQPTRPCSPPTTRSSWPGQPESTPTRCRIERLRAESRRAATMRLGVLGWPVAHSRSPAIQNAALPRSGCDGWRYQLLPVPPELFAETVPALPRRRVPRRQRDDPAQGGARWRSRPSRPSGRARSGPRTRSRSSPAAQIAADNTDAPALIAALPFAAARARPRAGARRRRERPRRRLGAARRGGARGAGLEPNRRSGRASCARELGGDAGARSRRRRRRHAGQLHVGRARRRRSFGALPIADERLWRAIGCVVDLVYTPTGDTRWSRAARAAGVRDRRRARDAASARGRSASSGSPVGRRRSRRCATPSAAGVARRRGPVGKVRVRCDQRCKPCVGQPMSTGRDAEATPTSARPAAAPGKLISGLGGTPHEVVCPWCRGTGQRIPGIDAQELRPRRRAPPGGD